MVYKETSPEKAASLFENWQESLIWSCLQNVMGSIYVDSLEKPESAMALLGDFCFLAGVPKEEIVRYKPKDCENDFIIMVPQNEAWAELVERCYKEKAKKVTRYAIKKELGIFDRAKLEKVVADLPKGYEMKMIDEELFCRCKEISWCGDFVSQYEDYKKYQEHGLGVLILKDGEPVSGASSYSGYEGGIEIEIDTEEEYRRKGLASCCGAKLILECLKRGWYPSWDAQNTWSVSLAEKLGYHFSHEYTAYEIWEWK